MAPRTSTSEKPKRRKKRKSRTEVSSDSDTELESKHEENKNNEPGEQMRQNKEMSDTEVSAAFTTFYMQRMATEFSEDLDRLRNADDFKDDAMPLLINALQQGTSLFSIEEQRRIVMAGVVKEKDN